MLTLHHESQRAASYRSFAPIEWSESLRSWCVFDPDSIIAILKSPDFDVVDYAGEYAKLGQQVGIDWQRLVDALHYVPLANEGSRHARLRRDFAQLISARSAAAKAATAEFLTNAVPLVLEDGRSADLVEELIRPTTDLLFRELIGVPVPKLPAGGPSVSQIFDRFLSLNRRRVLQDKLARLSEALGNAADDLTTSLEQATALLLVGHDSLLASLGASLVAVLEEGAPHRLCELRYPETLPRTGVPYVERVSRKDCQIRDFKFRAGARVRLFLDACPARGASEEPPFFGKGRHLCVGKELSQWAWQELTRALVRLPLRVRLVEARIRQNDYVFTMYDKIEVTVHV